jgi:hypothetical protein
MIKDRTRARCSLFLKSKGMFRWVTNSRIIIVLKIEIKLCIQMQICCSGAVKIATIILLCVEDEITAIILNSPLLFPINNPNNIFIIQNNITFLLFSR